MTVTKFLGFLLLACFFSCQPAKPGFATDQALQSLQQLMAGTYSSELQSKEDKDFYAISLRMVPIWQSRGYFLYVEQALFTKQDQPYRVRIYELRHEGDQLISRIYTLKEEKKWVGKWKTPKDFEQLTLEGIELKSGCEVVLKQTVSQVYEGQTGEKTCPSELKGASYATSKVTIDAKQLRSWDQGFDKDGKQVWGATKSGYIFDRLTQ